MSDTADSHEPLTFVVRLWHETDAEGHGHWRGRVEHVASQEVGYVEDVPGVASFIERWTGKPATAPIVTTAAEHVESMNLEEKEKWWSEREP